MGSYRLPDGTTAVLISSDDHRLVACEAAALLSYATDHPEVSPESMADMLFRSRGARRHRVLAMVHDRDSLLEALRAVAEGIEHPRVVAHDAAATERTIAHVFPGQGGQRPGMGRLFYEQVPAFRAAADRCADAFTTLLGWTPLAYLLDPDHPTDDRAITAQPALFVQMVALDAMWRSAGVIPSTVIGHSQGEIAAAYTSGMLDLADAVRVVGVRAHLVDGAGDYAMAVIATDRDVCGDLLARSLGWAEVSVVNSPDLTGISGDRRAVEALVETATERGIFARLIPVGYPAHTSMINGLRDRLLADLQRQLSRCGFADGDTPVVGSTLGAVVPTEVTAPQYWFWNLRNVVRFDKAVATAAQRGVDTFIEVAEHPTLQVALHQNLHHLGASRDDIVLATSDRAAHGLEAFTLNLARLAVADLNYPWESLAAPERRPKPPLPDFPNTVMAAAPFWLPYDGGTPQPPDPAPSAAPAAHEAPVPIRTLTECWERLSQRALLPPRVIGVVDHTGSGSTWIEGLGRAAAAVGATVQALDPARRDDAARDLDTLVILSPPAAQTSDPAASCAQVRSFFADRTWWPGTDGAPADVWLVTVGAESVGPGDPPPALTGAALAAGFRSFGAEFPERSFKHVDLPADASASTSAAGLLSAVHTKDEPEIAVRDDGVYVKRIVEGPPTPGDPPHLPYRHVVILGGTGNLGLEFCEHFAARGAHRITLVSRSGRTATVAARLRHLDTATRTQIDVAECDLSDDMAVADFAERNRAAPADLIIHAALSYDDIDSTEITTERADRVLAAKVLGIDQVMAAFPRTDDCRVVLCSSVAATIGGRGQILYAAANRMLDAFAHHLRARGVDCLSVQWGQWTTVRLDAAGAAKLAATGMVPMEPADARAVGITRLPGDAVIAAFDLAVARPVLSVYGYGPLLARLAAPATAGVVAPVSAAGGEPEQRLKNLLAGTIGLGSDEAIDADIPMVAIGLDSLQALEFRRRVQAEFDYELDVTDLLGGASITDLAARMGR